jgi:DNA-binding CsgD family transcriptional regulator
VSGSLIGRDRERAELERLIAAAIAGTGAALVVRGEPGIGKTALLEHAAGRAEAMTVLRVTGVGAESDLAFAALHGLLRPVVDGLDQLVEAQSRALAGALGLAPAENSDRLLVAAAVLGLLAVSAEHRPVLCVVDDAHWLDRPSADALAFAARRLHADRIAMLFATRDGEARRFEGGGLPELALAGVDERAASGLLDRHAHHAAGTVRRRLLREAAGNPLALLELPTALTEGQLGGREPLPEGIPLTPRLRGIFRRRIEEVPAPCRSALLACAADNTGDVVTVLRAAAELGLTAEALAPAEHADLIRIEGGAIVFRHPLVRAALYDAAPLSERRRVHSALASALDGDEHADRRAWHQAMAALTGDERVAAALEESAHRARRRAGHASAATAFQRAAELTRDHTRLAPRLASAAAAAWDAGQPDRARELVVRALRFADPALRARLLHLRGTIEARAGDRRDAVATLLEGVALSTDPSQTLEMLLEAAEAAADTGDPATAGRLADRAAGIATRTMRDELSKAVLIGFGKLFSGDQESARASFEHVQRLATELGDDPRAQMWAANAASLASELGAGLPFASRAVDIARRNGLLSVLPVALEGQAMEALWRGHLDLAYAAAEEGRLLSLDLGTGRDWPLVAMAWVEAVRGREDDARGHAEQVLATAHRSGETFLPTTARMTLGLLELTIGRPDAAAELLLELTTADRPEINPIVALSAVPDAIEAIMRAGRPAALAERPLTRFRDWADGAPTDGRRSLLARCEALVGRGSPEPAFERALELATTLAPFQRARTQLLYGEWLRRERRRTDARTHLRAAAETFGALGATPWQARADAELRATGETARKREPSTLDQLTPQEFQVAELVAAGMTNRAIGAQLFLSPRTVEYHLRKIFSKLGIASRTELVRHGPPSREA